MYRVVNGVFLNSYGYVIDERLDISMQNDILNKFLLDVQKKLYKDTKRYLNSLNLKQNNKLIVHDCITFCKEKNIIEKDYVFYHKNIWSRSRLKMLLIFIYSLSIWVIPLIPFLIILNHYNIKDVIILCHFYIIHLLAICVHEISHSIAYWIYQYDNNGYFTIGYCSCGFIYNDKLLNKNQRIIVAAIGSSFTIIIIIIIFCFIKLSFLLEIIEIVIQITSLILGNDGNIIKEAINQHYN